MPKKTNFTVNGKNYYRTTATIGHKPDGTPIRKQFYGSTKKEARQKKAEYILNISKGLSANFDKAVFRHVFEAWFYNVLKPTLAPSSLIRYETDYRLRIKDCVLSNMKLTDIKSINIQAYYNGLLERCSANTVRNTHKLLKNFFGYCIKADLIIKNPLAAVELPVSKPKGGYNKALSKQDIETLVGAAKRDDDLFIFLFAIFTGLRLGELLALTHNDIDFKAGTIQVSKTVSHITIDGEYGPMVSTPKTSSSIRQVPILEPLKEPLKNHMRNEKMKHLRLGIPFAADNMLFSSEVCTYRDGRNVRKTLVRTQKKLGMQQTTFHALRHTFCTLLAEMGVPLKTASVLMGHSNISVTAQIYTHVDNEEMKKGIEKLSSIFSVGTA
jgi:integrase